MPISFAEHARTAVTSVPIGVAGSQFEIDRTARCSDAQYCELGIGSRSPRRHHAHRPQARHYTGQGLASEAWGGSHDCDVRSASRESEYLGCFPQCAELGGLTVEDSTDKSGAFVLIGEQLRGHLVAVAVGHCLCKQVLDEPDVGGSFDHHVAGNLMLVRTVCQ